MTLEVGNGTPVAAKKEKKKRQRKRVSIEEELGGDDLLAVLKMRGEQMDRIVVAEEREATAMEWRALDFFPYLELAD